MEEPIEKQFHEMNLPKLIEQKQSESESYAILLYALRKLGIFRNVTENDYGIDFEIELVINGKVTGRYIKVQVKSREDLVVRQDGVPTVGGVKQSTLFYWTELSYSTHVLLFLVDLKTEEIYMSRPLFWQATKLIDASEKSKTIECIPFSSGEVDSLKTRNAVIGCLTMAFALSPTVREQMSMHTIALRMLSSFLKLYSDVFWLDHHLPIDDPEILRQYLEVCVCLIQDKEALLSKLPEEDLERWASYAHWHGKSQCEAPLHYECRELMKHSMPMLLAALTKLRATVAAGAYYWTNKNPEYLRMTLRYNVPVAQDHEGLVKTGGDYHQSYMKDDWEVEEEIHRLLATMMQPTTTQVGTGEPTRDTSTSS